MFILLFVACFVLIYNKQSTNCMRATEIDIMYKCEERNISEEVPEKIRKDPCTEDVYSLGTTCILPYS